MVYPSQKILDSVDNLRGITEVLVVPWQLEEIENWIKTWGTIALNEDLSEIGKGETFNIKPIIEVAIESLNNRVNKSTGINHPRDRSATIQMFEILIQNGIDFNPDSIRGILISQYSWEARHAEKVKVIAMKLQNGKKLSSGSKCWNDKTFDIWIQKSNNI